MPIVHNPTAFDLFCRPLGASIAAGGEVEVTAEQAEAISTNVFVIVDSDEPAVATEALPAPAVPVEAAQAAPVEAPAASPVTEPVTAPAVPATDAPAGPAE